MADDKNNGYDFIAYENHNQLYPIPRKITINLQCPKQSDQTCT